MKKKVVALGERMNFLERVQHRVNVDDEERSEGIALFFHWGLRLFTCTVSTFKNADWLHGSD